MRAAIVEKILMSGPVRGLTAILSAAAEGDAHAAAELLPLVYEELRTIARLKMRGEPHGHTLQPTALVHECYLRLLQDKEFRWDNRSHFFAAAAEAMRRILVEHARHRLRLKRGGGWQKVELNDQPADLGESPIDVIALDEALSRLEHLDKRKSDLVKLRYFAGLSIQDTAELLGVSPATVKNDWSFARAWLHRELSGRDDGAPT